MISLIGKLVTLMRPGGVTPAEIGRVDSSTLDVFFPDAVDITGSPTTGGFTVTADGNAKTITGVTQPSAKVVRLALTTPITYGQAILLSYSTVTGVLTTARGQVKSFGPISVVNNFSPHLVSVEIGTVDASTIVATFSELINAVGNDFVVGFVAKVNGVARTITAAVQQSNHAVIYFTLMTPATAYDTVTLSYSGMTVYGMVAFTNTVVTNNVDPVVISRTVSASGKIYTLVFDEAPETTGTGNLWDRFTLKDGTTTLTVASATLVGATLAFTINEIIYYGDTATDAYNSAAGGQGLVSVVTYTAQTATNNSTQFLYFGATINPSSVGNGIIDLAFSSAISSPTSNYKDGFTLKCREPGGTYRTLDPTKYTCALEGTTTIRVTLTGTVAVFQTSHEFSVAYNAAVGNIVGLATFTANATLTNNSTVDLLSGVIERYSLSDLVASIDTGHNLTNNNTVTFVAGKLGNAANLVVGKYLSLGAALIASGNYSLSFWWNPASVGVTQIIITQDDSFDNYLIVKQLVDGTLCFRSQKTNDNCVSTTIGVPGTWYHVVVQYNGTQEKIWINATNEDTDTATAEYTGNRFHLGANQTPTNYADGLVDELTFWDHVLTSAEITAHKNGTAGMAWPYIPDYV